MDAPVSQLSSPLLTTEGWTAELFGLVRLRKEKSVFGRVLDMSDSVIGSCGNEGRGVVVVVVVVVGGVNILGGAWKCQEQA